MVVIPRPLVSVLCQQAHTGLGLGLGLISILVYRVFLKRFEGVSTRRVEWSIVNGLPLYRVHCSLIFEQIHNPSRDILL